MRKITEGPVRNKEKTKGKLLDAVGVIIAEQGFSGLNILKIARKAGVDKKLIYIYWGGLDGIVKDYLDSTQFWGISPAEAERGKMDSEKDMMFRLLEKKFESLMENPELCAIIAGELLGKTKPLKELAAKKEQLREHIFNEIEGEHFQHKERNIRALVALLMGGINYLNLYAHNENGSFCGIDIKEEKGKQEVKNTIKQIIEWAYL